MLRLSGLRTLGVCLVLALTARVASAQSPGLVAAYGFNEGAGATVPDLSGNNNTATISGAAWAPVGKYGGAMSFDGTSNWLTINHSAVLSLTNGMTLEAWINTTDPTNWRCVLLKERSGGLSYALYGGEQTGRASGWIRRTADVQATGSAVIPTNTWVHLATTYDGASLRTFVNGVQVAATAATGNIVTSTLPLRIGGNSIWGEYFSGLIDEVRVYNRALTAAEIQTDMNTPLAGGTPPPTYTLSGTITPTTDGSGSTVSLTGPSNATTSANASGAFSFSGLFAGTYTVTPSKSGFGFTPTSRSVTISTANVTGVDFTIAPGPPPPVGINLIQKAFTGYESAQTSASAAFPSANAAGNLLIVTGTAARPAGTLTISDTLGNTYLTALGPVNDPNQDVNVYIWYVPNAKAGSNTVTIQPTSARPLEIHISEWSGVSPTSSLDQTAWATGTGTAVSSGAKTPTMDGELIFGLGWVVNSASAGAGFTPLSLINGDLDEYLIQQTAAPVAATFTQASGGWVALMATFRPQASGPDTAPPTSAITAPAPGANVFGPVTLTATASDNVGVAGVQFQVDGANVGSERTTAPYTVTWNSQSVDDGNHSVRVVARDAAGNSAPSPAITVNVVNGTTPQISGQWGASFDVGMVAVNMVMMHTGKVLMFAGSFASSWTERVWDPATGTTTLVPNPYYNLFCAGQAQLPDGRILVAGGYDSRSLGAPNANIFDPVSQTWSPLPNMAYRRWYPTVTGLADGRMLVTSGAQTCFSCLADVPEIFDPKTNTFSQLTTARLPFWYYPFMFVLPGGKVLSAGSNEQAFETRLLDVTAGTWTMVDPVIKDGHSAVMYQLGKVLKTGTAADSGTAGNAAATAYVIDMTQPSPAWRQIDSMKFPRAFQNMTILPDGNVLVTGGGTALDGYDVSKAVLTAELWSPTTEKWTTLSKAALARLYHSTALLLPDARVLIAGSGDDGPAINQTRAEIYSPPYLFKGARPSITGIPDLIQYGTPFTVQTPDAASITSVALIRPGSPTHGFDEDQRFLNLSFTVSGGTLTVQAPATADLAPPGYYMVFLVNSAGVPSVASFVHFPIPSSDTQPPTVPGNLNGTGGIGSVALTWNASTDDTGVALYNVHRSTVPGVAPTTANRVAQTTATSYSASSMAPGNYYYVVTAQDLAGNVSGPSNEAAVTVLSDTTAPTVTMTSPANQSTVSGSIPVSASASDDVGVVGVQFQLDGNSLGAEDTAAPYSITWNSTSVANGTHTLGAVARDAAGNRTTASVSITVSNTAPPPAGLVAAYSFNEGAGNQVTDSSGLGNNGTITNATWSTSGHAGSALSFNGTNASVSIPDSNSLDLTTGMTLEAWVRPTIGSGWRTVILKEAPSSLSYALYSADGASRPTGWITNPTDYSVAGTAAVALNTWTHLAVTYDGSSFRFYTNGVLVRTTTNVTAIRPSANPLKIGGNSVWGEFFQGLIDDVRIYNRALTAGEITTDMNTPIQ